MNNEVGVISPFLLVQYNYLDSKKVIVGEMSCLEGGSHFVVASGLSRQLVGCRWDLAAH